MPYYVHKNELTHHGILGMKWGLRRFQNKDGTLTDAGKKRYTRREIEQEFNEKIANNSSSVSDIKKLGSSIGEMADKLGSEYEKAYTSAHLDDSSRKEIIKQLQDDFGNGCDDEDFYDMALDEYVSSTLDSIVGKKIGPQRAEFDSIQDQYWDKVHDFTSDMIEKYGDAKVVDASRLSNTGKDVVSELAVKNFDTSFNSYIFRHFDDYWVKDIDARYSAVNRLKKEFGVSMDDYNRKYATN